MKPEACRCRVTIYCTKTVELASSGVCGHYDKPVRLLYACGTQYFTVSCSKSVIKMEPIAVKMEPTVTVTVAVELKTALNPSI
eukprot:scaffold32909_cov193-Skeletonema_marinoi.AAC.1